MQYISDLSIDTHGKMGGPTTIKAGDQIIEGACRVELVMEPGEPVMARVTLYDPYPPTRELTTREVVCPNTDLKSLVALLEDVTSGEWRVDGQSWKMLPGGDMQVAAS